MRFMAKTVSTPAASPLWAMRSWTAGWPFARQKQNRPPNFEEYGSGKSYREIVAGLNADGIKTKRGSAFGANSLHDLLKNEKYIGTLVYGQRPYREDGTRNTHAAAADSIRIENAIPAIIDKELFAKVQDKMAANKRQQGGRPPTKRDYPLKGKVFCAECKSAMTISTSQKSMIITSAAAKTPTRL